MSRLRPLAVLGLAAACALLVSPTVLTAAFAAFIAIIGAARSLAHREPWGPADDITTIRLGLVIVFAALVPADHRFGWAAIGVGAIALALDGVDGRVARRTVRTDAGAEYDETVDALFILVLALALVPLWGPWCAIPGLLYYAFRAIAALRPAWRRPLPASMARKAVAASQGVLLLTAGSPLALAVPTFGIASAAVALALLVWSFGRDVLWLERHARCGGGPKSTDNIQEPCRHAERRPASSIGSAGGDLA